MAGAGEGDVGEAQILATLLRDGERVVGAEPAARRSADVERPLVVDAVKDRERRRTVGGAAAVPQEGAVDDRELEPLGPVDGQHLDGLGVRLEPPAAVLVGGVLPGLGDPLGEPGGQRRDAELALGGGLVEELPHVAEVGHGALAVALGEDPGGEARAGRHGLEERRDAAGAEDGAEPVEVGVKLFEVGVADLGEAHRGPAEEPGQGRRRGEARRGRALDRPQQAQPLVGGAGAEDASRAVDDRGDADLGEGVAHERGLAIGGHENRQVPGTDRDPTVAVHDLGRRGEEAHDVGREVARHVGPGRVDLREAGLGERDEPCVSADDPDAKGGVVRRAGQPACRHRRGGPARCGRGSPRAPGAPAGRGRCRRR